MIKINGKNVSRIPINGKETLRIMRNGKQLWSGTGLPAGYTILEYIESTGSSYIDTGILVNKSDNYKMELQSYFTNNAYGGCNGYMQFLSGIAQNKKSVITVDYYSNVERIYVDGILKQTDDWTNRYSATNVKLGLFRLGEANNQWWTGGENQKGKMFYCKIYNNDELIRDYIPCINPRGIYGLYDKVNKLFYGSASSTPFTIL